MRVGDRLLKKALTTQRQQQTEQDAKKISYLCIVKRRIEKAGYR